MPPRKRTPESYTSEAVRDLLDAERIFYLRTNAGTILLDNKDGSKRAVKLAAKGTADLCAFVPFGDGSFMILWCETKRLKGGRLSPEQAEFRDNVTARGHSYIVAKSSQDVLDWLIEFRRKVREIFA